MERYLIPLAVAAGAILLLLTVAALLILLKIFYAARGKSKGAEEFPLPEGGGFGFAKTVINCFHSPTRHPHHVKAPPIFGGVFAWYGRRELK